MEANTMSDEQDIILADLSDEELVFALYYKYKKDTDSSLSLEEFQMAVGYLPDGFSIEKD